MKKTCDICGGSRQISVPVRPSLTIADASYAEHDRDLQEIARIYPCPECAGPVSIDRVDILEYTTQAEVDHATYIKNSACIDAMKTNAAHGMADRLLAKGMISFEHRKPEKNEYPQYHTITGRLGIATPAAVATIKQRIAARQEEVATEVIETAMARIDQQYERLSHYQAQNILREALRSVLAKRASPPEKEE